MSDEMVVAHCSPTLAGLKTGSLFACPMESREALNRSLRRLNAQLVPRGVRILPVKYLRDRILIYMYRPGRLQADLHDAAAAEILAEKRYPAHGSADRCVAELIRRLNCSTEFPHEIGLFLGYPSEDVAGFMRLGARRAKLVGAWRVYGDAEAAQKKFALYKKCTRLYRAAYGKNHSLDRLVVSSS